MTRLFRSLLALAIVAVTSSVHAQPATKLEVIVFAGGFNWPIWAAQDKGFFRGWA